MKKIFLHLFVFLMLCNNAIAESSSSKCKDPETSKLIICKIKNMLNKENKKQELPMSMDNMTPGFDFVCYNSCKDRNDENFCMKKCSLE